MTAPYAPCLPSPAMAWLVRLLLACACLWLLGLALLTAAALRDRWRAWRRGPTAEPGDGGPEVDRLIAESMAAWRADVAGRIARRVMRKLRPGPTDGLLFNTLNIIYEICLEELERSDHAD